MNFYQIKTELTALPGYFVKLVTQPRRFYSNLPRTFSAPTLFLVFIGVLSAAMLELAPIFGFEFAGPTTGPFLFFQSSYIVLPLYAILGTLLSSLFLFIAWKLLGTKQGYQVAFASVAYAWTIFPFTLFLGFIPVVGVALAIAWYAFLLINASIYSLQISPKRAWGVFGLLFAALGAFSISFEMQRETTDRGIATEQTTEDANWE